MANKDNVNTLNQQLYFFKTIDANMLSFNIVIATNSRHCVQFLGVTIE
jgi:hypothetical protein